MTGENKTKTLGIKAGTLGLSKPLGKKLTITQKVPAPSSTKAKGKVVIVTKGTRSHKATGSMHQSGSGPSAQYLSADDKERRLKLLKDAEETRKQEQGRKDKKAQDNVERDQEEKKREKLLATAAATKPQQAVDKAGAVQEAVSYNYKGGRHIGVVPASKPHASYPAKHETAKMASTPKRREVKNEVPIIVERLKLRDVTGSRVKNLDNLYRATKPEQPKALVVEVKNYAPVKAPPKKKEENEEREPYLPTRKADRKAERKMTVAQVMMMDGDDATGTRRRSVASIRRAREKARRKMVSNQKPAEKVFREVNIPDVITVSELSNRMAEKAADVIKALMKLGMMVTVNQSLDADTAELVATEFGHKIKRVTDAELESALLQKADDSSDTMLSRPPVVTVMGHVDHGKTSLLDALRDTDIAAGEAGGITQHIGAYQVCINTGEVITFLDTPGHEAFTAMRMRGAKVTDIVVLVVAADDGIMPQTVEAISHAKAAGVPIIVAINKIDKPDANPQKVKNEILSHGLIPDDMGGDTMVIELSAKQKLNIDKLEEAILVQADMLDLKANPNRTAEGTVIEAKVEKGRGPVATVLVQKGSLKVGDIIVAGSTLGKVKALANDKGKNVMSATPSTPIEVLGLGDAPVAGDEFAVVTSEKVARDIVVLRNEREKQRQLVVSKSVTLDQLFKRVGEGGVKELPVIIKADVQGSTEAIINSLQKLATEEIVVRVIHSGVGGITESDVTLARASRTIIIGFNVRANQQARDIAKANGVDIRYYSIIYNLVDDVKAAMSGLLSPIVKENIIGYVDIRQVFDLSKHGKIAGCYVTEGTIKKSANVRIIRDSVVIYDGKLKALKRFKDDVREVGSGFECGVSMENYDDVKIGDRIEVYELSEHMRTI